mmetsp:Transcript_11237/g.15682  ORF Transcript_11237/g.15682 Transcript_11237/m.15682 type:complete len:184 (-) Transcript_11237:165-716(-)
MGAAMSSAGAFAIQTGITYLSQTGILGKTNKEVSDKYFSLTTPAGYAFAIWGVIFTWEGVFMVNQLFNPTISVPLAQWWISANVCQSLWSFTFAQEAMVPSATLLSGIAVSLYGCIGLAEKQSFWLVRAPISLHAGWVTVAALLNWNLTLVKFHASSNTQVLAAYSTLFAATTSALGMLAYRK